MSTFKATPDTLNRLVEFDCPFTEGWAVVQLKAGRKASLNCPECKEEIWDLPRGHKLAKCWNAEGHQSGAPFAFDTMGDDDDSE